ANPGKHGRSKGAPSSAVAGTRNAIDALQN
ncbi:MAG: hypothetical protein ACI9OJ_002101, partial [Myxococcota bacterium]